MKRFPPGPTLFTLVAVIVMVGLGVWQLQRRDWKLGLIAAAEAAPTLPPLDLAGLRSAQARGDSVQYRRASIACRIGTVTPYDLRPGTSMGGQPGYLLLVPCAPGIVVAAGWTGRPDALRTPIAVDTEFAGMVIEQPYGAQPGRPGLLIIPDTAVAPLTPGRQPTPGDLPNNHLAYAFQWFGFALTLGIIYAVWLRRRWHDADVAGAPPHA